MSENINLLTVDSLGAERSVIGSMLIDDQCVKAVMAELHAADLADGPCRNAYQAIRRLSVEGKAVDPVLVQEAVGGGHDWSKWAASLMEATPTAANVMEYVRIVKECAQYRRLREGASKVLETSTLADARQAVQALSAATVGQDVRSGSTASDLATAFWERLKAPKPDYIPWGIETADAKVCAQLGDMILLGGYPSAGKTLLSLQFALLQAKKGYKIGYYSLETTDIKVTDRIMSHLSGVPLGKIKDRALFEADYRVLAKATAGFASLPFDVIEAAGWTVDDITAHSISRGYQIIYIDYLQLVPGPEKGAYERVSATSRKLKIFAPRHRVTVVALAQLTRPDKVTRKDGTQVLIPPTMQSFKESGQMEQDADAAFLLWESIPDDYRSPRKFKLGKNKEGERFTTMLAFDGARQRMVEMDDEPDTTVANDFATKGRAVKAQNRASAKNSQVTFQELSGDTDPNPFTADKGVSA